MKIHLSRWVCLDVESNLERAEAEARSAVAAGARVVVFPESFLHGYTRKVDPKKVRELFGRISSDCPETLFFFGAFSEGGRNRMTAWCGDREVARYDKVHLFEPNGECAIWSSGDRYGALDWGGVTWGLLNCNDIRFPEQARALRLKAGCGVLVAVAWWPWRRAHIWEALLRARAIENACFVLGCCVAASRFAGEEFAGAGNHAFDPMGEPVRSPDDCSYEVGVEAPPEPLVDPGKAAVDIATVEMFRA